MMKKWMLLALTLILAIGLSACSGSSSGKSANNGKTVLTLALWDTNQKKAMQEMADAFTKENPNIKIKVEVTPWDQYWTKLQAGASGGNTADVFWM